MTKKSFILAIFIYEEVFWCNCNILLDKYTEWVYNIESNTVKQFRLPRSDLRRGGDVKC